MIKPGKRSHSHILERLKRIREKYKEYHFELAAVQPPKMLLKDMEVEGLEAHYLSQMKKHPSLPKDPNLQNYCCLFVRMLRKLSEGDENAVCKADIDYALKTIIALDAKVKILTGIVEGIINPKPPTETPKALTEEEEEAANKMFNGIRALVRAMNTLSTDAFTPWTQRKADERLIQQARSIIAQYKGLGFIKP